MKIEKDFNKRLLVNTTLILLATILLSIFLADSQFTLGFIIGGFLTFLNYFWLNSSTGYLLKKVTTGQGKTFSVAFGYLSRYIALSIFLYLLSLCSEISPTAVLVGLLTFPASVIIEGFILIAKTFTTKEERA